jgi:hypothetical protein
LVVVAFAEFGGAVLFVSGLDAATGLLEKALHFYAVVALCKHVYVLECQQLQMQFAAHLPGYSLHPIKYKEYQHIHHCPSYANRTRTSYYRMGCSSLAIDRAAVST